MSDRNQRRTVTDTTILNYFVKTIGIQIGVVFAVIALLFIVFLSYQSVYSNLEQQEQNAPASNEDAASNDENTTPVDVNVPDTLNTVRSQYSFNELYLGNAHPDVWYDDYTLWSNAKKRAIALYGGSEKSERAVQLALRWLKSRQSEDGSWAITDNAKPSLNVNGATGLASLPFLAAGCLDSTSEYKDAVENGLNYLVQHGKTGEDFNGVRYCEPGEPFYNHALATLALGEAAVKTGKSEYYKAAKGAMEYLAYCQNPDSGVWDSALSGQYDNLFNTAWSVEAMRGAYRTSYDSALDATSKIRRFLDSVRNAPEDISLKAAQELLLRMFLYRFDAIPNLELSAELLSKTEPNDDAYYNYIVTQIMYNHGGAAWKEWNAAMREKLINAQIQTGTEAGAWDFSNEERTPIAGFPPSPFIDTALSALTLEVYYRYKPLHLKREYGKGFPIE